MFQPLCLGGRGLGPSRLFSIFQRGCQVRKRPGATLSLGYELIFLPVPAGEDPMTGIGFALGLICSACPPASWLEHHCTTQLPGSYSWIPVLIKHKTHTCVCVCAVSAYNIGSNYVATFSQNHKIFHQDCWLKFELSMTQICWKKIFKR